jgi:putative ABC transport system substrate-binding protein
MSREATANISNRGLFGLAFCATLFAVCVSAQAQPAAKVSRIGFLVASSRPFYLSRIEAFRDAMVELGYTEGKNIVIEYRFANGNESLLNELANELVDLKLDLIVAAGSAAAAKNATKTIPIVFTAASDPVASGIVPNLAQPAGNITGLTILAPELTGKRLELLKEAFPKLSRVGLIDSRQALGLTEAITRGLAFKEAGADNP